MAKKQYWNSEVKNERWIKQGRGQGLVKDYKPWLTVRDVPSQGRAHRIFGHLTQRNHHLLSDLELATFLLLQWRQSTTDIREQFPLDPLITTRICADIGVVHAAHSGVNQIMSSDFLVNSNDQNLPLFALQVKPSSELENPRTIEKLEVEKRYWAQKDVPWFLITEKQIPKVVFSNIEWLYNLQHEELNGQQEIQHFEQFVTWLKQTPELTLIDLCKQLDTAYSLELGESLYQLRSMLAKRYFHFDILIPYMKLRCCDLISEPIKAIAEVSNVSG